MLTRHPRKLRWTPVQALTLIFAGLLVCASLTGCLVAGYSSSGGAFIWPGGLGLVVVILLVVFLLRRR